MENVDNTPNISNDGARPGSSLSQPQNENQRRNRNLDILKAYIQRQRTLLERIKQDVSRLQASKPALDTDPSRALSRIVPVHSNVNSEKRRESQDAIITGACRLTELVSEVHGANEATITKNIDWGLFRGSDLTPVHSLQPRSRFSLISSGTHGNGVPPLTPSTPSLISPRSSLSSFVSLDCPFEKASKREVTVHQIHVREERVRTIVPALTIAAEFLASLPPDSDDECVKQARAKDSREAKEAKAKEAKDGRKAKVQTGKANSRTASTGHVRKSAHRRKSEASAAAAASRPRGLGGRFKKKDPAVYETSVPGAQTHIHGASASALSNSVPISTASTPEIPLSGNTLVSLDGDPQCTESGRPQRVRKPSIRFGSAAPSIVSTRSTRSGSSSSSMRNRNVESGWQSSSPALPSNRGRLTIRIPARLPTKSAARDLPDERDRQISASTSMATATSTTESTSLIPSVDPSNSALSGNHDVPLDWSVTAGDVSSPTTATLSTSQAHSFDMKQEEMEQGDGMDVDSWGSFDEQSGRFGRDLTHQSFETLPQVKYDRSLRSDRMDLCENELDDDSTDSFVPEMLPPLPSSATSSSTASRNGANGSNGTANGNSAKRAESSRASSRRGDPSSKTFNVSWSDEEQRLLDMLLERYPDGTKNRWANISRAMGGIRTPRQVASRVQKYFAKMKKWGIDVN